MQCTVGDERWYDFCAEKYKKKGMGMKRILLLFVAVFAATAGMYAQKIYATDHEYQADVKVYVVDYAYQADLLVYVEDHEYQAKGNEGKWYFVEQEYQADVKVYFVEQEYQADVKIYYVDYEYQAGWQKDEKRGLLR